ncbi:class I lanthipeptide [Chitinophaga pendula]|nr:class I lanthipeptide [Chitinophaga pendula]
MKKRTFNTKLSLQKVTIARLSSNMISGGGQQTFQPSCVVCPLETVKESCNFNCITIYQSCGSCLPESIVVCPEL